jgi:hypothetical protein
MTSPSDGCNPQAEPAHCFPRSTHRHPRLCYNVLSQLNHSTSHRKTSRYLVQEAQGAGGTAPLPAPQATGTIAMAAGAGKVALQVNSTPIIDAHHVELRAERSVRGSGRV